MMDKKEKKALPPKGGTGPNTSERRSP